jgi:hypothetical protein
MSITAEAKGSTILLRIGPALTGLSIDQAQAVIDVVGAARSEAMINRDREDPRFADGAMNSQLVDVIAAIARRLPPHVRLVDSEMRDYGRRIDFTFQTPHTQFVRGINHCQRVSEFMAQAFPETSADARAA